MAGPAIDPKAAAAIQQGATKPGYQDMVDFASKLASGYQNALQAKAQPMEHVDEATLQSARDNAATPSDPAENFHMQQMAQKAQLAKQQYMKDNGVDEDGNPVAASNSSVPQGE